MERLAASHWHLSRAVVGGKLQHDAPHVIYTNLAIVIYASLDGPYAHGHPAATTTLACGGRELAGALYCISFPSLFVSILLRKGEEVVKVRRGRKGGEVAGPCAPLALKWSAPSESREVDQIHEWPRPSSL